MSRIVVLGAGVMGTAFTVPAADNGHEVALARTRTRSSRAPSTARSSSSSG
jgi:glycerol-3-phosphate dehydrogenase